VWRGKKLTRRWLCAFGISIVLAAVLPRSAVAQGDGPRTHWKEFLTDTSVFSLTYLQASGNTNPLDPAHSILRDADFEADLVLVGYSHSFSLLGRTAMGSILVPAGEVEGEVTGPISVQESNRGFGDPVLQLDVNLIGAPAMRNMPELLRFEPDYTVDLVLNLGIPIGEYDDDSPANIGQNRWYGRVGAPIMVSLREWVPGKRTTLELLPAVYDDSLGQRVETDPMLQLEAHVTHDFTESFWGSLDGVWYFGAESEFGGMSGDELSEVGLGFTFGYSINDNLMLTAGYTATVEDGRDDLDLGVFRVNLVYGWHRLLEGIKRLGGGA
jgi:hypothetical protein